MKGRLKFDRALYEVRAIDEEGGYESVDHLVLHCEFARDLWPYHLCFFVCFGWCLERSEPWWILRGED